jgi:hypothetical protein
VNHVIAVLVFSAACVLLFAVQRWAGDEGEAACDECERPGCARREAGGPTDPEGPDLA